MNTRRWRMVLSVLPLALIAVALLVPVSLPTGDDVDVPDEGVRVPLGALTRDVTVTQQFVATGPRIREIQMEIGTYQRVNRGTLRATLEQYTAGSWRTVGAANLPAADLRDNAFAPLPFPSPLIVTAGRPLRLVVQSDEAEAARAVTWWVNPAHTPEMFALSVNGVPQRGTARFAVRYERAEGPLYAQAGAFFVRVTPLLGDFWRGVLLAAAILLVVLGGFLIGRWVPE